MFLLLTPHLPPGLSFTIHWKEVGEYGRIRTALIRRVAVLGHPSPTLLGTNHPHPTPKTIIVIMLVRAVARRQPTLCVSSHYMMQCSLHAKQKGETQQTKKKEKKKEKKRSMYKSNSTHTQKKTEQRKVITEETQHTIYSPAVISTISYIC